MPLTSSRLFALVFLAILVATATLRVWLAIRQLRHVAAHRGAVPAEFSERIPLALHHKAADYTCAKTRLGLAEFAAGTLLLLAFTYGGFLQAVNDFWLPYFTAGGYAQGLALFGSAAVIGFIIDLPFALYRTFVLEARYGFNQMSWPLFLADLAKQGVLAVLIGAPVLLAVLWLMAAMGSYWWLYVWLFWLGFNLLVLLLYPTLIAPLFNKFVPLDDAELKSRIEALLSRCGFRASGLFVMDGSKRSAHGNAYFTGFGAAKRIVFFDTLLSRLTPTEIEAVLAHELGHYQHRHVWQRIALLAALSLGFLWLLGLLMGQPWFYAGLGVTSQGTALALILFSLVLPVFTFPLAPLMSHISRRHEYQADAYAASQTRASDLVAALVKLYRDNAATLTPDPLYSLFYDSHPPAVLRIAHLHNA
ncbi:protease HtpX [mine drainage metagenome]|uniref:Protease HtpX n=1 Tax=mine drainage metagenome TaxID=410659 RepID=A0A1J5RLP3_9ZZZZ